MDLDAHTGDGTYALSGGMPGLARFDIAGAAWCNVGNGDAIACHVACHARDCQAVLQRLPAFLDRVRPVLVQYQAGMDCFERDPVGGIPGVSDAVLAARDAFVNREVVGRGVPLVVNLGRSCLEDGTSERLHAEAARICVPSSGPPH